MASAVFLPGPFCFHGIYIFGGISSGFIIVFALVGDSSVLRFVLLCLFQREERIKATGQTVRSQSGRLDAALEEPRDNPQRADKASVRRVFVSWLRLWQSAIFVRLTIRATKSRTVKPYVWAKGTGE